jgi:hypothetical protein
MSRLFATFALIIFLTNNAFAVENIVCMKRDIVGLERTHINGTSIVGSDTTEDRHNIRIYVENTHDGFYFQSNFCKSPCSSSVFPTKIFIKKPISLKDALENVIFTAENRLNPDDWAEQSKALLNSVEVFADKSIISAEGGSSIDMSGATRISIVSGSQHITLASQVSSLSTSDGSILTARISGCCLDGFPPLEADHLRSALDAAKYDPARVKFASLVADTATVKAINESVSVRAMSGGNSYVKNLSDLKSLFKKSNNSTLMLLGHVEGDEFVTRDASQRMLYSISFNDLNSLARENNINLIHLGCNTARQIATDTVGAGVSVRFNTVDLVKRLNEVLPKVSTFTDLLAGLSADGLKIVVNNTFASAISADIYSQSKTDGLWVKVARLLFYRQS